MPLLEAFLALALTLLSLAMIATLIVEFIHRLAGTRSKDLKMMLEKYYDQEIKPMLITAHQASSSEPEQPDVTETMEKHKAMFINTLLTNPLINEGKTGPVMSRLKGLAVLSTEDLFKKLACTDVGKKIKTMAEGEIDEALDSLSQSYDAFGAAATDLFKRKAQITSLVIGVVVAFALNANAFMIFKSYLNDPQARAKAVAQAEAALENITSATDTPQGFQTTEELVKHVNSIKAEITHLGDMDTPIGYGLNKVPATWFDETSDTDWRWPRVVFWALGVLATGLLIGLGGPFWFNVVRKLTDVLQVVRGAAPTAAEPGIPVRAFAQPVKTHRDTFRLAGRSPSLAEA